MDASKYGTCTTRRGYTYGYRFSPPHPGKSTILFVHGFPATSRSWRAQAAFFAARGHGVVVPDLLGYGSTDKPHALEPYACKLISKDVVDILEKEGLSGVVAVGHDW